MASRGATRLQQDIQHIFQYIETPDLVRPERGRCSLAELPRILAEIGARLELAPIRVAWVEIDDPNDLTLALSRQWVELALGELLENARKFHPQQSPKVEVTLVRADDAIHIHVCDDGQILSPDQLARAWQPYYQGERFFTGQVAGMGLGLSMVAALIWRASGSFRIYNREAGPGVGVELSVPLAGDAEPMYYLNIAPLHASRYTSQRFPALRRS